MIEFKHQIGKRILRDWERFGKPEYGSKRVENLAKDLEISSRDLWYCIQFARKYPELENSATPLQNLSWRKIVNEYLPEHNNTGDNDNDSEIPEMPKDTFDVIYADPPWRYDFSETESRRIEQQYPTMDIDKIKNLQIPCNGNAILFLWATAPKLTKAKSKKVELKVEQILLDFIL